MIKVKTVKSTFSKYITVVFALPIFFPTSGQIQSEWIYILQWTYTADDSCMYRDLEMGLEAFVSRNCSFINCFITPNRSYFDSVQDFDVLLFNTVHLRLGDYNNDLPLNRTKSQLYVLFGVEPAWVHPLPGIFYGFFNLTWTYKLTSDIVHPYFVVKNIYGHIIGPKTNMHWMNIKELGPINNSIVQKLQNKRIAAAWVATNCFAQPRLNFVRYLRYELTKYGHRVDTYGFCGNLSCTKIPTERNGLLTSCYDKIESDYYFYLAFENSMTEDYVTEKVLHGLQHFAVPVVFGGADYTRFLPDGIYINALKLGAEKLAKEMNDIINDPPRYYDFFKWHGYYSFYDTADNNYRETVCAFCAFLNNEARRYKKTEYVNIKYWWKDPLEDHTFPEGYFPNTGRKKENELIYILQWTQSQDEPWHYHHHETGQEAFISRNCSFKNCYITDNREYFDNILDFDVLVFNTAHLRNAYNKYDWPKNRSELQLYVVFSIEPSLFYPISVVYNNFFNLTWTYKLTSDIVHPYFVVKNYHGNIIGPKINMNWLNMNKLAPINSSIVDKLRNKSIAAAWVVTNCLSPSRKLYIRYLSHELSKYGHRIDIYGNCGNLTCPRVSTERHGLLTNCYNKIELDYYFYLAFENSIAEDYVTEKVLHGLRSYAVPIVFGGADYTRFLPDGIYLDAIKLGAERLAKEMNDIINDPPRYYDFFKWHGHYSFQDTGDERYRETVCAFCALLNNRVRKYKNTVYVNMKFWWKAPYEDDTIPAEALPTYFLNP